jgi:hypothetical protein
MEKSMKSTIAMSDSPLAQVQALLALRSQVLPNVSAEVRDKIQNLKGVLDPRAVHSARNGGDWRRGTAGSASSNNLEASRFRHGGSHTTLQDNAHSHSHYTNRPIRQSASTTSLGGFSVSSQGSHGSSPRTPGVYTGPPLGRYQSRFKNTSEPLEEKILNQIIRLKLNKFGPTTYNDIRDFLFQILGQESVTTEEGNAAASTEGQVAEFICDFMLMVFRKAAAEEIYCPLYARLLSDIGSKHSCIFEEMHSLYDNYMDIFEEADLDKVAIGNVAFEKKNIEKKYRQGYSQFIAELTALEILTVDSLAATFTKLISLMDTHSRTADKKPLVEEYVDCLLRMSRVMKGRQTEFFRGVRGRLLADNKERLTNLIHNRDGTYISLSPKARFLLMDIQDILTGA